MLDNWVRNPVNLKLLLVVANRFLTENGGVQFEPIFGLPTESPVHSTMKVASG